MAKAEAERYLDLRRHIEKGRPGIWARRFPVDALELNRAAVKAHEDLLGVLAEPEVREYFKHPEGAEMPAAIVGLQARNKKALFRVLKRNLPKLGGAVGFEAIGAALAQHIKGANLRDVLTNAVGIPAVAAIISLYPQIGKVHLLGELEGIRAKVYASPEEKKEAELERQVARVSRQRDTLNSYLRLIQEWQARKAAKKD